MTNTQNTWKAAVNQEDWQYFDTREDAVAYVQKRCRKVSDSGWVRPTEAKTPGEIANMTEKVDTLGVYE